MIFGAYVYMLAFFEADNIEAPPIFNAEHFWNHCQSRRSHDILLEPYTRKNRCRFYRKDNGSIGPSSSSFSSIILEVMASSLVGGGSMGSSSSSSSLELVGIVL
jgi:hypothetical protein